MPDDNKAVVELLPEKPDNTGEDKKKRVIVDKHGVIRDEKGRFLPGTKTANPAGRPHKKQNYFEQQVEKVFASRRKSQDLPDILYDLIFEMAAYDERVDYQATPDERKKFFRPKWNSRIVKEARIWIAERYLPKQVQTQKIEAEIDANIQEKCVNVTFVAPVSGVQDGDD